jgi:2-oxoisovalerate dehydrogenase E1 component alpha subunit
MSEHQALRLHVPEPSGRPGCTTDFSYLHLAEAGAVRRPPLDATHIGTADLAYTMIRVLDRVARAVGPWAPEVPAAHLRKGLRKMMKTRIFDARMVTARPPPPQTGGPVAADQVLADAGFSLEEVVVLRQHGVLSP